MKDSEKGKVVNVVIQGGCRARESLDAGNFITAKPYLYTRYRDLVRNLISPQPVVVVHS